MSNDPRIARRSKAVTVAPVRKRPVPKPEPVVVTKVHPAIWREAMRLARGDRSKITVVSPTRVEVTQ